MTSARPARKSQAEDAFAPRDLAAPRTPGRLFALKHADTFLVADAFGDILGEGDGLFRNDTRVLSLFRLSLGGEAPSLLGAAVSHDNTFFTSNLTNRPLPPLGGQATPEGVIHLERKRFLWQDRLYERILLANYGELPARVPLALRFAADFRDMFEVRGQTRAARGSLLSPQILEDGVLLRYEGLDGLLRTSALACSVPPDELAADRASFALTLPRRGSMELYLEVGPDRPAAPSRERYRSAAAAALASARTVRRRGARLRSTSRLFNDWLDRSRADIALLTTELPTGPFPYAGIPWYSTPFGRDAIITALQTLWLDPSLARGVLAYLSQHQASQRSRFQDAAPGKIMHETRKGEMAALRELPFGRYYGGVDTTPLFVMLAGAYAERTGELSFIDELWPALTAAMAWIDGEGDSNHDGFLDYARGADSGLANQGWKDSVDSVFHSDGSSAGGPVALVEVQGYVYAARRAMAKLAAHRGIAEGANLWRQRAEALRDAVEARFWMEDRGFYALALDGRGRPCRVRASNAGHLLYVGLPAPERAAQLARQLLSPAFDAGWGVRTLAQGEVRFNPMSYHNGSVWPHDTALCAAGLARNGERRGAIRILSETFEAAVHFGMRLPELYCGFTRAPGEPPIAYPVACLPQAWSAGAVFMMLQACLGLTIDARRREVMIDRPELPMGVDRIELRRLAVGDTVLDLVFERVGGRIVAVPAGADADAVRITVRA